MADHSPEEIMRWSQFDAGLALVDGAARTVTNEQEAEKMFRRVEQIASALALKFRKGNELSAMLSRNRLQRSESVVSSRSG